MAQVIRHNLDELQLLKVICAMMDLREVGVKEETIQIIKDELKLN